METKENVIMKVEPQSIAQELEIMPGDILLSINGKTVQDVFDYRYLIQDEYLLLMLKDGMGQAYEAEVEKDPEEDLGIVFASGLMDEAKSCRNKCIFCFIDQLPKGMRETLYFKDDDSRLSFLQGNYVTLTNMSEQDMEHILFYHLSPINISVHTTDPALRVQMLKNPRAGDILPYLKRLFEAGIEMNLQVVLCKGVNDGQVLSKTIADCAQFMPLAKSMSVVPIGLTRFREGLFPMEPFGQEDAAEVIRQVEAWQTKLLDEKGTRFVYCADEFYLKADRGLPSVASYEGFAQYENGVGMLSLLEWEFFEALESMPLPTRFQKTVAIATGIAAFSLMQKLAFALCAKIEGLNVHVYKVKNHFFGENITVSGLLTGQDIIEQLDGLALGEKLLLPDSLLRNGTQTLLDDLTLTDISKALFVETVAVPNTGKKLIQCILNLEDEQ